jgi:hypothetical protein
MNSRGVMDLRRIIPVLISDIKVHPLYWATMATALLGAYWSSDISAFYRGMGFFVWIFSNFELLVQFYRDKNVPMVAQFFVYEIFNIRGCINNWFPGWELVVIAFVKDVLEKIVMIT